MYNKLRILLMLTICFSVITACSTKQEQESTPAPSALSQESLLPSAPVKVVLALYDGCSCDEY